MTTANLATVDRSLRHDHARQSVVLAEVSVDPGRDSVARLAAYAKMVHARWQLLTESLATLPRIAAFFDFYYRVVEEESPAGHDWWTHKPLTYDVDHSDGFVVIDSRGFERWITGDAPNSSGRVDPKLRRFLSPLGLRHLRKPPPPSYRPGDMLDALGQSLGRRLPVTP